MLEFLDEQKDTAQALMEKILSLSEKDIEKANLRDKMGALKILAEVFAQTKDADNKNEKSALDKIVDGLKELK